MLLNLIQHLENETLKQVQGDAKAVFGVTYKQKRDAEGIGVKRETASAPKKRGSHHSHPVMLNSIQHLKKRP